MAMREFSIFIIFLKHVHVPVLVLMLHINFKLIAIHRLAYSTMMPISTAPFSLCHVLLQNYCYKLQLFADLSLTFDSLLYRLFYYKFPIFQVKITTKFLATFLCLITILCLLFNFVPSPGFTA